MIGRVVEHGQQCSEEMCEAALMLENLGMSSAIASAIADVQQELAARASPLVTALEPEGSLAARQCLLKPL